MRTTVDIEGSLLKALRREALKRQIPVKHLLNRLLRQGLAATPAKTGGPYRVPTFSMGEPLFNTDKALNVAAALEDDEVVRKLLLRK
jgi:hypothetical protein